MNDPHIRPEIQSFIDRANNGGLQVEISEVEHLSCSPAEADALTPVLTDDSLARRMDRVLINVKLPLPSDDPKVTNLWALYRAVNASRTRLMRRNNSQSDYDLKLGRLLTEALAAVPEPELPTRSYVHAMWRLGTEARNRFFRNVG